MGIVARTRERLQRVWCDAAQRYRWLDHTVAAWVRFRDNHGNHYAAAITYFSFLAIFPLVLLAVAVLGFVLRQNQELMNSLLDKIAENANGAFGDTLKSSINAAVRARTGVGILGLVGLMFTGLGWIGNLRAAINAMWGVEPPRKNFLQVMLSNLVVLVGLGLATLVSIGLTVAGTELTDQILRAAGLDGATGAHTLVKIFGIVLAVVGDTLIFAWLLVRLPDVDGVDVPGRIVLRGGLLTAVGFELLKILGSYYIAQVTKSPAVGIFGSVIGLLIWIYLVARYVLFCAAWTATAAAAPTTAIAEVVSGDEPGESGESGEEEPAAPRALSPVGVAVALFGAGAATGGALVARLKSRGRRRDRT